MANRSRKQAQAPRRRVVAAAASDPAASTLDIDVEAGAGIEADTGTERMIERSGKVDQVAMPAVAAGPASSPSPSPSPARRRRRRRSHQGHGQSLWTPTATKFVIITATFVALTGLLYVLVHLVL